MVVDAVPITLGMLVVMAPSFCKPFRSLQELLLLSMSLVEVVMLPLLLLGQQVIMGVQLVMSLRLEVAAEVSDFYAALK